MNSTNTKHDYLGEILEDAEEEMEQYDMDATETAWDIATTQAQRALVSSWDDYSNLELLKEIREHGELAGDNIEPHMGSTPTPETVNEAEAMIEAILINSLERLVYDHLTEK